MEKNIGFKVTVEFDCTEMMDEKTFHDEFGCDAMAAYKFISGNFLDSPINFSIDDRVVKVELLNAVAVNLVNFKIKYKMVNNRKLKFKAYDKHTKKPVSDSICYYMSFDDDGTVNVMNNIIICQFTGRLDDNEKEIGIAMQKIFASGKVKREDIFWTSKCPAALQKPERLRYAIETTLAVRSCDLHSILSS